MSNFDITLTDATSSKIFEADCYQQEGPLTTFFKFGEDRRTVDSWSSRLASFKTANIESIARSENPSAQVTELTAVS